MRILLFTTHLNIGGIATYTVGLAKALKRKGEDVFVVSSGGVLVTELTKEGISHKRLDIVTKSELSPKIFKAVFRLYNIVKKLDIDIIHAQTRVTQVVAFVISRLSNVGFVTTCHGFFNRNIGRMIVPAWGDRVIAISEAVEKQLKEVFYVDSDKISLVHNGIDVERFMRDFSEEEKDEIRGRFGIKNGCPVIGMISRFTPDKGQDMLVYAFREILKENSNIQLVFVGGGRERRRIIDLVRRFNISDKVIFIDPQIATVEILSVIDVFMFIPKRKEGLGIAMLEAMASGKVVIATNTGGISSVVEDGVNGFLVEPSSMPISLVAPTLRLLKDKELHKRMSQSARRIVKERFSIDTMADETREVYRKVIME